MAILRPQPRAPRLNRFQTPTAGMAYVPTAVDAHFDPYAETPRRLELSEAQMEQVARVPIV